MGCLKNNLQVGVFYVGRFGLIGRDLDGFGNSWRRGRLILELFRKRKIVE